MILRDTSPDNSNLERAYENARKPKLPGVTCPSLVTVGRTDWVTPA